MMTNFRKVFLLLSFLVGTTMGVRAQQELPEVSTSADPTYYLIKNLRSGKYAAWTGVNTQVAQTEVITDACQWLFVHIPGSGAASTFTDDDGEYLQALVTNAATPLWMTSVSRFDVFGNTWYVRANPYNTKGLCISLKSDLSADCWDDQNESTKVGSWNPRSDDNEGTTWIFSTIPEAYNEIVAEAQTLLSECKNEIGVPFTGYKQANYDALVAAIPSETPSDLFAAVKSISAAMVALKTERALPDSSRYYRLEYRDSKGCYFAFNNDSTLNTSTSATDGKSIFQFEDAGNGNFYLKSTVTGLYVGRFESKFRMVVGKDNASVFKYRVTPMTDPYFSVRSMDPGVEYPYLNLYNSSSVSFSDEEKLVWKLVEVQASEIPVIYGYRLNLIHEETNARKTLTSWVAPNTLLEAPTFNLLTFVNTPTKEELTVDENNKEINIYYKGSFPFALTTVSNGKFVNPTWYKLTLRGTRYVSCLYNGDGVTNFYILLEDVTKTNTLDFLWCFGGNVFDGVSVYNAKAGTSQTLRKRSGYPILYDGEYLWELYRNSQDANGFTLKRTGSTNDYINDYNSWHILGFWEDDNAINDDGSCFRLVENPEIDVAIDALGYVTRCFPFAMDLTNSGLTAYTVSRNTDSYAVLSEFTDGVLPPYEGVILYAPKAGTYKVKAVTGGSAPASNKLVGVTQQTSLEGGYAYVLASTSDGTGVEFALLSDDGGNGGNVVPANRAYLPAASGASAQTLSFTFGTPTAIENATVEGDEDVTWYTLGGVAVKNPSKGIYVNSKGKVVLFK